MLERFIDKVGTINILTKTGATLTSDNVLAALRKGEERQKQHNVQYVANEEKSQERAVAREIRRRERDHRRQRQGNTRNNGDEAAL